MALFGLELPLVLALVGIGLLILETVAPTEYFLILGAALVGAGVVGTLFAPASAPIVLALLTILFGIVTFYGYREFGPYSTGEGGRTKTASSLRGQTGTVTERVTASEGRVRLDDGGFNPYYQARALDEPIAEGEEVIVTDPGGGNVLTVTDADALAEDEIDRALRRDAAAADAPGTTAADATDPTADATDATATDDPGETPSGSAGDEADANDAEDTDADDAERDLETERSE